MYPRLRTLIRVDLSRNSVLLQVRGCFTTTNYRALVPMIRRAHALPGHPVVVVDITSAQRVDPAAASLLEDACRADSPSAAGAVPVLVRCGGDSRIAGQREPRTAAAYSLAS